MVQPHSGRRGPARGDADVREAVVEVPLVGPGRSLAVLDPLAITKLESRIGTASTTRGNASGDDGIRLHSAALHRHHPEQIAEQFEPVSPRKSTRGEACRR